MEKARSFTESRSELAIANGDLPILTLAASEGGLDKDAWLAKHLPTCVSFAKELLQNMNLYNSALIRPLEELLH